MEWTGLEQWNGLDWNGMEWNAKQCACADTRPTLIARLSYTDTAHAINNEVMLRTELPSDSGSCIAWSLNLSALNFAYLIV